MGAQDDAGGPPDPDDVLAGLVADLRADRDSWRERALEAEAMAESLADDLAQARREDVSDVDDGRLPLFASASTAQRGRGLTAADGSDLAVLPVALGALALVAALTAALTLVWTGLTLFAVLAAVVAAVFAITAWNIRIVPVDVDVVDSVVLVRRGGGTRRFDLTSENVRLDVRGRPGDADWRVRLFRGTYDPTDVDATMVDPDEFMALLREHRPGV